MASKDNDNCHEYRVFTLREPSTDLIVNCRTESKRLRICLRSCDNSHEQDNDVERAYD